MSQHPILIIGGGLGGLFTGALLAQAGRRVVVLEQLPTAGGGLQQFRRYGCTFGTGMHVMGGLQEGGALHRLCRHLGIREQLVTRRCDAVAEVTVADGTTYVLPTDTSERRAYLRTLFPAEAEGLERYEAAVRQLVEGIDLFNLRPDKGGSPFDFDEHLLQPTDAFVAQQVRDPRLRQLLQFADLLYDGRPGHTAAYIHAVVSELYLRDTEMPVAGLPSLAEALTGVITTHGGEVRTGTAVTALDCTQRHITAVSTSTGEAWEAEAVVSAISPTRLLTLLPEGAFPGAFARRVQQMPPGVSAFKVFYALEPERIPFVGHPCYFYQGEERWMFVTPPHPEQGAWARTLEAIVPMSFDEVRPWADSTTGHRPEDYEAWKLGQIQTVTDRLESRFPGFRNAIRHAFAASPLTWRDWLGSPDGAMFGPYRDCLNPERTHLSVTTKIDNLFLTGQCVNLHGICGTPLTAVLTAEAIMGKGSILNQL
jgi:phytoene dehydrogenase-like protein